ncbi:hypothetical protein ACHAO9_006048, partial [Fusarium lateritium]
MPSLQSLVVLILVIGASEAVPRGDRRDLQEDVPKELANVHKAVTVDRGAFGGTIEVTGTSSTDYRTMPPGTYTETISSGLVKIIVVNNPTPTTVSSGNCPEECDCTRIKDKESP